MKGVGKRMGTFFIHTFCALGGLAREKPALNGSFTEGVGGDLEQIPPAQANVRTVHARHRVKAEFRWGACYVRFPGSVRLAYEIHAAPKDARHTHRVSVLFLRGVLRSVGLAIALKVS
jgi:hypothetical protein